MFLVHEFPFPLCLNLSKVCMSPETLFHPVVHIIPRIEFGGYLFENKKTILQNLSFENLCLSQLSKMHFVALVIIVVEDKPFLICFVFQKFAANGPGG